jgi:ankyrin repeat protein
MSRHSISIITLSAVLAFTVAVAAAEEAMTTEASAMSAAIAVDDVDATLALLRDHPALLTARLNGTGLSPLHAAAKHNARRVSEALVGAGTDFYARDVNGQLPLDLPPGQEMNDTRKWLREVNKSRNAFLGAVHEQNIDRGKELLGKDPSLATARDIGDGWSAVMTACDFGNEELLGVLLEAGATVDAADFNSGQDAVHVCAEKGQADCLKLLIDTGANVGRVADVNYGRLPMRMNALHIASWKGHKEVVRLLLAAKVDANERAKSYAMFSPLHFAATEGHAEIVALLLQAGADPQAHDGRRGITALEMAEAGKHEAAVKALRGE